MLRNRALLILLLSSILLIPAVTTLAENWAQWRGPANNGLTEETNPPVTWSKTENVLWRLPLPGPAGSTPAIWGDRIFLTSSEGNDLLLICANTSGTELWRRKLGSGNQDVRTGEGNYASPSPSTDGKHVWAFTANGLLSCYDFEGNKAWGHDLQSYGKFDIQFGLSSTPLLVDNRIIVQLIHGTWNKVPSSALILCFDKTTGKELWKHVRKTDAVDECKQSYTSPILYDDNKGERFLLTHGADYVIAHELDTGDEIWRCGGLNPKSDYEQTLRFVASPAAVPGLIVVPTAKKRSVVGIRPGGKGDITGSSEFVAWTMPRGTPDVSSPLIHDNIVYLTQEKGTLVALDATTGKQHYKGRLTPGHRHRASPVYADGKIYCASRQGVMVVIKACPKFEILAKNDIGEELTASPIILDGRIYLRSFEALYAIGPK